MSKSRLNKDAKEKKKNWKTNKNSVEYNLIEVLRASKATKSKTTTFESSDINTDWFLPKCENSLLALDISHVSWLEKRQSQKAVKILKT